MLELILTTIIAYFVFKAKLNLKEMGSTVGFLGAIAAIVSIVAAGISVSEQRQASRRQRSAQREQQRRQRQADARRRQEQVREARVRRATAAQRLENAGAGASSVAAGSLGSISSQLTSNVGFQSSQAASVQRQSALNIAAASDLSNAATLQGVASLGQTVADNSERIESAFGDLFGNNENTGG